MISIFCDFDGTLTSTDIGFDFFDRYGRQEPLISQMEGGEITIEEYWQSIVRTVDRPVSSELVEEYLAGIKAREGIDRIGKIARRDDVRFTILSDGLDVYIEPWLRRHDMSDLPLVCNTSTIDDDGRISVSFPFGSPECSCRSAVCKRNVAVTRTGPEEPIIYIGDGLSDFCPVDYADVIFARDSLAAHCTASGLPHHSWKNLREVARTLERVIDDGVRPRHQARAARRRVWIEG